MKAEEAMKILEALRKRLDETDHTILIHFAERMQIIRELHHVKVALGIGVLQEEQFASGLTRRKREGEELHLQPEQVTGLFDVLHQLSVQMQDELRENTTKRN